MSVHLEGNPDSQSISRERVPPLNPTRLKVAGFVMGFLLVGLAVTFHCFHINAIAVYSTGSIGGILIIGMAIWTVIDRIRQSKEDAENLRHQRNQEEQDWLEKAWAGNNDDESSMQELHNFLFSTLINAKNIENVQPLGKLLPKINDFLNTFNKKYSLNLQASGSAHSSKKQDRWQTIKIIDLTINQEGQVSIFLNKLNDYLYEKFGIISNGGDSGSVIKGKKKQAPVCFIKAEFIMYPQIQISLIDIKRILDITSNNEYFQELNNAYIW